MVLTETITLHLLYSHMNVLIIGKNSRFLESDGLFVGPKLKQNQKWW